MHQNTTGKYESYLPKHSEISVAPVSSVVLLSGQRKQKFSALLGWYDPREQFIHFFR